MKVVFKTLLANRTNTTIGSQGYRETLSQNKIKTQQKSNSKVVAMFFLTFWVIDTKCKSFFPEGNNTFKCCLHWYDCTNLNNETHLK